MFSVLAQDYFVHVLFAFVALGLVSLVLRQETGSEVRLQNDLFLCRVSRKTFTHAANQTQSTLRAGKYPHGTGLYH